jgi:peptidoglycan endopeptidase LytE
MHAAVLVIALTVSGYATLDRTGVATNQLRLGAINAEGQTIGQGGTVGDVSLGRLSTIIKPVELPTGPPVAHFASPYVVADGDDLKSIADKFGITADDLRWSNASLTNTDLVKAGDTLTIPPVHGFVYTTAPGDSVSSIADRFHVDAQSLSDFNYLRSDIVSGGRQLVIPGGIGPDLFPRRASYDPPHLGTFANSKFAYGYCTWYVASRRPVPWTGDAWEWYGGAKAMGYPVGQTPQAGAIMVTWESWVGHVAYVEQVNSDGSFIVSEMNYKGWGIISTRTLRTSNVPLIGFIYDK